ncbi:MAG: thioredoxin-disulfide reductase [Negativicutes bacterium]|nr:thioredoxin-disulfide reductase [Negativicutes bacterium]
MKECDVAIIGAGPAGLTAALYCGRAKLQAVCVEKSVNGGQVASTEEVENYPGFMAISGPSLAEKMAKQAEKFGVGQQRATVQGITPDGRYWLVRTTSEGIKAKAVIIATGAEPRLLGCPGESDLRGRGVSYCAVCDGAFYEDADNVVVVGGGDSAVEEAVFLTKFARCVTLIHRRDSLRAAKILQDRLFGNQRVKVVWNSVIGSINGRDMVESVTVRNIRTGSVDTLPCEGVFVYVGMTPQTGFAGGLVAMDDNGYIITDETMATNMPGIFAAGDNRVKGLRQIVTAAADGAVAAFFAARYIEEHFG